MFHHLDAILTELRIKNREALNFHFESLLTLELKSSEAEALMQRLYRKMSSLQDICPDTFKHEDTVGSEIDELQEILVQLSVHDKEVDKYRKQIIELGQEAYKLYSSDTVLERDETCQKVLKIAMAFENLYSPVLYVPLQ